MYRSKEMAAKGESLSPAITADDCVTESRFDNVFGCRHSLATDGIMRTTDALTVGNAWFGRARSRRTKITFGAAIGVCARGGWTVSRQTRSLAIHRSALEGTAGNGDRRWSPGAS